MTGLIGWWPLNENSGQANDLSGNGNHGTPNGATQGVAGKMGDTAYSFDGSDDYISVSSNKSLDLKGDNYTVSLWTRFNTVATGSNQTIFNSENNNSSGTTYGGAINLFQDDNSNDLRYATRDSGGGYTDVKISGISTNQWYHFVFVRDNGICKAYLDGRNQGVITDTMDLYEHQGISIGSSYGGTSFTNGSIADVRLYNRALTPQEIKKLYKWGSKDYTNPKYHKGNDPGAISRWKLDGDVKDNWGTNNGTDNTSTGYAGDSVRGKTKRFNGSDDIVEVPNDSSMNSSSITVSAWCKPDSLDSSGYNSLINKTVGSNKGFALRHNSSNAWSFSIGNGDGLLRAETSNFTYSNSWLHITGVLKDQKYIEIHVNGTVENRKTISSSIADDQNPLGIGERPDDVSQPFDGLIDDVRIYNRALKPYEVHQLYQWGTRGRDMRKLTVNRRG